MTDLREVAGYGCVTPGCECFGAGLDDEPNFCSICLEDLEPVTDVLAYHRRASGEDTTT